MMQLEKKRHLENGCRQVHLSPKSPLGAIFCKNCNDYVEKPETSKVCTCCKQKTLEFKNAISMIRIINKGIKQHRHSLRDWMLFPSDVNTNESLTEFKRPKMMSMIEVRFQEQVYEVPIKYLALAMEVPNNPDILNIFKHHVKLKGLRFIIPDEEQTDTKCEKCNEFLKLDRRGREICPKCDKSMDVWDHDFFK